MGTKGCSKDKDLPLPPNLHRGEMVRERTAKKWSKPVDVQKSVAPRSYMLLVEQGQQLHRNRHQLTKTREFHKSHKLEDTKLEVLNPRTKD